MNQANASMQVAELMTDELVQGPTSTEVDNLSTAGRRSACTAEKPTIFITQSEVETTLKIE